MVRRSWLPLLSVLPVVALTGCLVLPLPVGRGQVLVVDLPPGAHLVYAGTFHLRVPPKWRA